MVQRRRRNLADILEADARPPGDQAQARAASAIAMAARGLAR